MFIGMAYMTIVCVTPELAQYIMPCLETLHTLASWIGERQPAAGPILDSFASVGRSQRLSQIRTSR